MADTDADDDLAQGMNTLVDTSKSTSEAFTNIGTELIEVKAMLMTLIDLQKAVLFASRSSETELETNVQNLLDGYRRRFMSQMSGRIKEAAEQA
jgi:hypothetical protein